MAREAGIYAGLGGEGGEMDVAYLSTEGEREMCFMPGLTGDEGLTVEMASLGAESRLAGLSTSFIQSSNVCMKVSHVSLNSPEHSSIRYGINL